MKNLLIIMVMVLFCFLSCCKSPTGPDGYKDPLLLSWTFDTLAYPGSTQTMMTEIWGSSPTNIYIVGHNNQPGPGTMFRLADGKWESTHFHAADGGAVNGAVSFYSIRGTNDQNVWAVGQRYYDNPNGPPNTIDSSFVLSFNGNQWKEYTMKGGRAIHSVWAGAPNNVWICGNEGSLFHFDGLAWERDSVPLTPPRDWDFNLWDITGNSSGDVYMIGYVYNTHDGTMKHYLFFKENTANWRIIDSTIMSSSIVDVHFGIFGLWTSPSGIMYSSYGDVYRYNGHSWDVSYSSPDQLRRLFGTGDNDLFAVGDFGNVLHFNGTSWRTLSQLKYPNIIWTSGWTDGKEVFILGNTSNGNIAATIIAHGK